MELDYNSYMHKQRAFTLVELSIVLVIIGLLVGGVLTGQSLIRAAELRSISGQYQRYMSAVMTFRDKYFALPGDMTNAQSYWGIANATPATCVTTSSAGSALTCNGDGNGKIDVSAGANEYFRFWQHLANAGLIEGSYSGVQSAAANTSASSANVPPGRISASLWFINNSSTQSGSTTVFDGQYDNTFMVGGAQANTLPNAAIFRPEEAYNIDTKLDDGKPATGKITPYSINAFTTTSCTNATASSTLTANYLLTNTALTCAIQFRQQF